MILLSTGVECFANRLPFHKEIQETYDGQVLLLCLFDAFRARANPTILPSRGNIASGDECSREESVGKGGKEARSLHSLRRCSRRFVALSRAPPLLFLSTWRGVNGIGRREDDINASRARARARSLPRQ